MMHLRATYQDIPRPKFLSNTIFLYKKLASTREDICWQMATRMCVGKNKKKAKFPCSSHHFICVPIAFAFCQLLCMCTAL